MLASGKGIKCRKSHHNLSSDHDTMMLERNKEQDASETTNPVHIWQNCLSNLKNTGVTLMSAC